MIQHTEQTIKHSRQLMTKEQKLSSGMMDENSPASCFKNNASHKELWLKCKYVAKSPLDTMLPIFMDSRTYLAHQCPFPSKQRCNCAFLEGGRLEKNAKNQPERKESANVIRFRRLYLQHIGVHHKKRRRHMLRESRWHRTSTRLLDCLLETPTKSRGAHRLQSKIARVMVPCRDDDVERENYAHKPSLLPILSGDFSSLSDKAKLQLSDRDTELVDLFESFLWMLVPVPTIRYQRLEQFKSSPVYRIATKDRDEATQFFQLDILGYSL